MRRRAGICSNGEIAFLAGLRAERQFVFPSSHMFLLSRMDSCATVRVASHKKQIKGRFRRIGRRLSTLVDQPAPHRRIGISLAQEHTNTEFRRYDPALPPRSSSNITRIQMKAQDAAVCIRPGQKGATGLLGAVTAAYEWSIVENAFASLSNIIGIRKNRQLQIRS
jgi:hypothetical protein